MKVVAALTIVAFFVFIFVMICALIGLGFLVIIRNNHQARLYRELLAQAAENPSKQSGWRVTYRDKKSTKSVIYDVPTEGEAVQCACRAGIDNIESVVRV